MFCVLDPSGQDWLTRASRGPEMVLGRDAAFEIGAIAAKYPVKGELNDALVPDFHSFRQALNVASADQRVLVLVSGTEAEDAKLKKSLRTVSNHKSVLGRFHFDFETKSDWTKAIDGEKSKTGIVLISPGEFGLKGKVIEQLPTTANSETIVKSLQQANKKFAATTAKKNYNTHVTKGRKEGIYFKGAVPYGEDRDGDGKVDSRRGRR